MTKQLSLNLRGRPALGRSAFLISDANARAVAMIDTWRTWPGGKLALVGAHGAGKTHLAHVWAEQSGALVMQAGDMDLSALDATNLVIEDVDRILGRKAAEEAVFHAHNAVLGRGGALLFSGASSPHYWDFALPDLASRLCAATLATLEAPDDTLLAGVMLKLFADRGVRAAPSLINFLVPRVDRSFEAAEAAVEKVYTTALAEGCPVGRGLASRLF